MITSTHLPFWYGQTFIHFTTNTQSNSNLTFWFNSKNVSTTLIILGLFLEVITPYSTIPVEVSPISSQNGATTTSDDDSGNDLGL